MAKYWQESPPILQEFLNYHASILSHSAKTVDEYFLDLRSFFRYLKVRRKPCLSQTPFSEISILDVDLEFVSRRAVRNLGFLTFLIRRRSSWKSGIFYKSEKMCVHSILLSLSLRPCPSNGTGPHPVFE